MINRRRWLKKLAAWMGFAALPVVPLVAAEKEKRAAQNTFYIQFERDGVLSKRYELPRHLEEDVLMDVADIAYDEHKDGARVSCRWVKETLITTINKAVGV